MSVQVQRALSHVKANHPEVTHVFYSAEGKWFYCNNEFEAPYFGPEINIDLLEEASKSVTELPAAFTLEDRYETDLEGA